MNIAICDDDRNCIDRIMQLLQPYQESEKFDIAAYQTGESFLCRNIKEYDYDIVFLDIEMGEISGLDIAAQLRKNNSKAIIIFVTSHVSYVSDTFRLGAFQFLVKPIDESAFKYDFERALRTYRNNHRFYQIDWNHTKTIVEYGDIRYIEGYKRHLLIHTDKECYKCVGKISDEANRLRLYNFVRCHQGYLVNLGHIKEINKTEIILTDNYIVPVSRGYRSNVMEIFNLFLAGRLI